MLYKCFTCGDELAPEAVIWVHDAPICILCFTDERLAESDDDFEQATGRATDERIAGSRSTPKAVVGVAR